jgi:probable HAF family extracellular repeat protein
VRNIICVAASALFFLSSGTASATPGSITSVAPLAGGSSSRAFDINDNGTIVGESSTSTGVGTAIIKTFSGQTTSLGTLGGYTVAFDVNNSDTAVGYSFLPSPNSHWYAFVKPADGPMTDLGTFGGAFKYSLAAAINNAGTVVGRSDTSTETDHVFTKAAGSAMVDLGRLGGTAVCSLMT